jgi:hypothetical protein
MRADGTRLSEKNALKRIKSLAIPPAWERRLDMSLHRRPHGSACVPKRQEPEAPARVVSSGLIESGGFHERHSIGFGKAAQ